MAEQTILCPHCKRRFALTEAMTQDIEEKIRVQMQTEWSKKEEKLGKEHEKELEALKEKHDKDLEDEKEKIGKRLTTQIRKEIKDELAQKDEELGELNKKVEEYRKKEKALSRKELELQDKEHNLEIEKNEAIKRASEKSWKEAREKADQEHAINDAEKDKRISDMTKQIGDLQKKLEQGSSQARGEIQEQQLEDLLRVTFPFDNIEPVAPGKKGGDVLQIVKNELGKACGSILWESKRTKSWSDTWLEKVKSDQRSCKADICVIVSEALPGEVCRFAFRDGVWICEMQSVPGLSMALRLNLLQLFQVRAAMEGMTDKKDLVYKYLTGNEFRRRIEAMVEAFRAMQDDLNRERTAMEKSWSAREKQITAITQNIAGMFGDLKGLGTQLQPVKALELPGESM